MAYLERISLSIQNRRSPVIAMLKRALPVLLLLIRLMLGATFLWAGLMKIPAIDIFAQTIRAFDILPLPFVNPLAIVLPWVEITSGVCLILGLWTQSNALISLFLLLSFGIALSVNLYRGVEVSCGCFSLDGSGGSLYIAIVRDVLLIFGSLIAFHTSAPPFSLDEHIHRRQYPHFPTSSFL